MWSAEAFVTCLDHSVRINAPGAAPTPAQLRFLEAAAPCLPALRASCALPDTPPGRGWNTPHPEYRVRTARITSIRLLEHGGMYLHLESFPTEDWSPSLEVSAELELISAMWVV